MHRGSHLPFDGMMMTMMMNILFVLSQNEELYLHSANALKQQRRESGPESGDGTSISRPPDSYGSR
jgi:hypothetical protein